LGAQTNKTELSIPAVLVSALIAFGAIPPMVVWAAGDLKLLIGGVIRDALAYAIALVMFITYNQGPEINALQATSLVIAFLVYLVVVYATRPMEEEQDEEVAYPVPSATVGGKDGEDVSSTASTRSNGVATDLEQSLLDKTNKHNADENEEEEEESGPVLRALSMPFEWLFELSIPQGPVRAFGMSLAWLCILSYAAMVMAEGIAKSWGISKPTAGITLLAWGGQLPDALAAVSLAKSGKPDEAITQAIASQVINVSIGLGLPLCAYTIIRGKSMVTENHKTILLIAMAVLASIVFYLVSIAPASLRSCWKWSSRKDPLTGMITKMRAIMLVVGFLVCYSISIVFAERIIRLNSVIN